MRRSIRALLVALLVAIILPAAVLAHWPVVDRSAYVSQGYHYYHQANDLAAPLGTYVVPIRSGTVVFAGWKNNCGGYQVWLSHGNNFYTGYYHMSAVLVGAGQYVSRGQQIGRLGMSGCATGPHLHFETWIGPIWDGGYRVNPLNYY
jgi:murein DD-endopeptidase MepM/ murein hydrolase activator NlpD